MQAKPTVGFIGAGVMGRSMATRLLEAGFPVRLHTRTAAKAEGVLAAGAQWADSPAEAADGAEMIITIVGFPEDVRKVTFGEHGTIAAAKPNAILVDMTTSEPALAVEIHAAARARRAWALDAPVSGGDVGARAGTLSIMVGGDREAFDRCLPLFEAMGKTIVLQGPAGSGQHCKMCNQITIASTMIGVMESLLYAQRSGLDPDTVLQSIGAGAAASWSLSNLQPRVVKGDLQPGFYVEHFLKDIAIALKESRAMGIATPALELAEKLYRYLADHGGAKLGTQAIYRALHELSQPPAP